SASPSRPSRTSSSSSSDAASTTPTSRATTTASRTSRARPTPPLARPTTPTSARRRRSRDRRRFDRSRDRHRYATAGPLAVRLPPDSQPAGRRRVVAAPGRPHQPAHGLRPGLSPDDREGAREELGLLRDPAAVPRDVGVRLRLPGAPGAAAVHRRRRDRRGDDRVLAERHLDDGPAALVGEEPGQPRALLRR